MSILDRSISNDKIKTVEGSMLITNQYTAGIAGEIFLRGLKDRQDLLASFCPTCKKAYLPARLFCERCLSRLTETRKAPHEGRLHSFTKVSIDLDEKKLKEPKLVGFITFKGFEGGMVHFLSLEDEKNLKIGTQVRPVFIPQSERRGSILDISHFKVIK